VGALVIFLLIILLFFSNRFSAVGRGLGEGIRNFKRGYRGDQDPPKPKAPALAPIVELAPPKLLPAKGESSAPRDEPPEGSRD
jgi:Sec-independent protein translocase protein TatA